MNFQKLASIFCVPYCVLFAVCIFGSLLFWAQHVGGSFNTAIPGDASTGSNAFLAVMVYPLLFAYYLVPSPLGIAYFVIAQTVIIVAWTRSEAWQQRARLIFFNAILFAYVGYIIWWFVTGQQFSYL